MQKFTLPQKDRATRYDDLVGAHQNSNGLRDLTTTLSGMVFHPGLALATINLSTKFKVCLHSLRRYGW